MTVRQLFEDFKDCGGSIIRIIADNGNFDTRIGYNYIDKEHSMWRNFMAMYGNYKVTEWYVEHEDIKETPYKLITLYTEKDNGDGKFDYNVAYTTKGWDEVRSFHKVHKSQLADVIEDGFANGGYDMSISCVYHPFYY